MMKLKNLLFIGILAAGAVGFGLFGRTGATEAAYVLAEKPDFADKPVKFVKLDFTLGQRGAVAEKAKREGLGDVYPDYKGATGFTLLVDADTGEVVDSLTIRHSEKAMRTAIAQAIAAATQ